jgi:tetratricopeptide (TPR) repeat protein
MAATILDVGRAVKIIASAARAPNAPVRYPYFIIAGAGVSAPIIPTADLLTAECRDSVGELEEGPGADATSAAAYSYWMERAHPEQWQRRKYIEDKIRDKPISLANLRLAHLLLSGYLTNIVVTPNFDDFVAQALDLLGQPHVLCDHPATVGRIDPERAVPQVVHVHGTYWFYDAVNLQTEISSRAAALTGTSDTMASFLDTMLKQRSPLVIGYSGWEGDVIMEALRRRLSPAFSTLSSNIYWFCYRREAIEMLPSWLVNHKDVRIVAPPAAASQTAVPRSAALEQPQQSAGTPLALDGRRSPLERPGEARAVEGSGGSTGSSAVPAAALASPTLPADRVLGLLINMLGAPVPPIADNPVAYFAGQMRARLSGIQDLETDVAYSFGDILDRIERARNCDEKASTPNQELMPELRNLMRSARYRDGIRLLLEAPPAAIEAMSTEDAKYAAGAMWEAAVALLDDSEEELGAYQLIGRLGSRIPAGEPDDEDTQRRIARAGLYEALTLANRSRFDEAVAAYDQVVQRFGASPLPLVQEQVAGTLFSKGATLSSLGRYDEAVVAYDALAARFSGSTEANVLEQVAKGLNNKGTALMALDGSDAVLAPFDEVVRLIAERPEPALQRQVAIAYFNKGVHVGSLGRIEESIADYDQVIGRFSASDDLILRQQVAKAMLNRGVQMGSLDRHDESLADYDEVVRRNAGTDDAELQDQVALALVNKGIRLSALGRPLDEIGAYDQVVQMFGAAVRPFIAGQVARALLNKGVVLGTLDRSEEALAVYDDIVARYGSQNDPNLRAVTAAALVNAAYRLSALERHDDELAKYNDVLARYGDATEPDVQEQVAKALYNKAFELYRQERTQEGLAAHADLVSRFSASPNVVILDLVAGALLKTALGLAMSGGDTEALAAADHLLARFDGTESPAIEQRVADGLMTRALILGRMGHEEDSRATLQAILNRFAQRPEPELADTVERARQALRTFDEAVAAPEAGVAAAAGGDAAAAGPVGAPDGRAGAAAAPAEGVPATTPEAAPAAAPAAAQAAVPPAAGMTPAAPPPEGVPATTADVAPPAVPPASPDAAPGGPAGAATPPGPGRAEGNPGG